MTQGFKADVDGHAQSHRHEGFDIPTLLNILSRRRWVFLSIACLVMAAGAVITLLTPKMYSARASVLIEVSTPRVLSDVREVYDLERDASVAGRDFYETQYHVLRSRRVIEQAVSSLKIGASDILDAVSADIQAGIASDSDDLEALSETTRYKIAAAGLRSRDIPTLRRALKSYDVVAAVQGAMRVSPMKDSRIAVVSMVSSNRHAAADLANAVVESYVAANIDDRLSTTRQAVKWLSNQMLQLNQKLEESEMALYEFKRSNNLVALTLADVRALTTARLQQLNVDLVEKRSELIELESQLAQLESLRADPEKFFSAPAVLGNAVIQDLQKTLGSVLEKRAQLALKYTEDHPQIEALDSSIKTVTDQMRIEANRVFEAARSRYLAVRDAERRLTAAFEAVKTEAHEVNRKEIDLNKLIRETENNRTLYSLVLKRQKEADLTQGLNTNNVKMFEAALPPKLPYKPIVRVNVIITCALALLLAAAAAVLADYLDNTIKSREHIESTLGVPFLGIIPVMPDPAPGLLKDRHIIDCPKSSVAECCRVLRTNLMFIGTERKQKTLLVTSNRPQEGKSTTAINLAVAFSQSGSKTLLVDTDMRRPRLHRAFDVGSGGGLSGLIINDGRVSDAVIRVSGQQNLDLLTCGPPPPNPTELLHTARFRALIDEMKEHYDRIIFDSPPVGAVADAVVLAGETDGTIMVVKASKTTFQEAKSALRRFEGLRSKILGAVLNDVDLSKRGENGYYYDYYYNYYTERRDDTVAQAA